jgi:hypothetical protein
VAPGARDTVKVEHIKAGYAAGRLRSFDARAIERRVSSARGAGLPVPGAPAGGKEFRRHSHWLTRNLIDLVIDSTVHGGDELDQEALTGT